MTCRQGHVVRYIVGNNTCHISGVMSQYWKLALCQGWMRFNPKRVYCTRSNILVNPFSVFVAQQLIRAHDIPQQFTNRFFLQSARVSDVLRRLDC